MAIIKSGATADTLTIDPISNAARVTLYGPDGIAIRPTILGSYLAPVAMRFTGTTAANSTVWAMRNGSSISVYIRRIFLFAGFDGTAAASTSQFEVRRFNTATPSGGTAITVAKKDSAYTNTTLTDIRQDTGGAALTVTSVVFESPMLAIGCPRGLTGGLATLPIDFTAAPENRPFTVLAPNEGLCIRNSIIGVVGDSLSGFIEWEER